MLRILKQIYTLQALDGSDFQTAVRAIPTHQTKPQNFHMMKGHSPTSIPRRLRHPLVIVAFTVVVTLGLGWYLRLHKACAPMHALNEIR